MSKDKAKMKDIRVVVQCKLVVLLIVAPLANLISIILTLEGDTDVSFADAHFGGVGVGINDDQSTAKLSNLFIECSQFESQYGDREEPLADFFACRFPYYIPNKSSDAKTTTMTITQSAGETVTVLVASPNRFYESRFHVDVRVSGDVYRIKNHLNSGQGKRLAGIGAQEIFEGCSNRTPDQEETKNAILPIQTDLQNGRWAHSISVQCAQPPPENVVQTAISSVVKRLTLINTEKFEIVDVKDIEHQAAKEKPFVLGDRLSLIRRRRSYMSPAVLIITVAIALICRIVVKAVTNNDIIVATEMMIKERMGMKSCDSLLQNTSIVGYRTLHDYEDSEAFSKDVQSYKSDKIVPA